MKTDRLIGILSVLLQEERVTAPELAERFEVSRRTINRDIDALCRAGIPVVTVQGVGGGISIMDGYKMDRTLLTSKDMQMILAGLRGLDSVSGTHYYSSLMEKLKAGSSDSGFMRGNESILIDLSSWDRAAVSMKMDLIRTAIEERNVIRFNYFSPYGEGAREIEPYYLLFKWSSWYVWGWCRKSEAFRLFKLNRMDGLQLTEMQAEKRNVPEPELSTEKMFPGNIRLKAVFDPSMKWHLIETYGADSFRVQEDGTLLFERDEFDKDGLIAWILSLREKVTVIEPASIREELLRLTSELAERYR